MSISLLPETKEIDFEQLKKLPTAMRYFDTKGHILESTSEREIQKASVPYYAVRLHYSTRGDRSKDAKKYFYIEREKRQLMLLMTPPKGDFKDMEGYPFSVSEVWNYGEKQEL